MTILAMGFALLMLCSCYNKDEKHNEAYITERVQSFYELQDDQKCCSKSYLKLYKEAKKISERDGTIFLDCDHWTMSNDIVSDNWKYQILSIDCISDNTALAMVQINENYYETKMKLALVFERGDWYVDNFIGVTQTAFDASVEVFEEQEIYYDEKEMMRNYIKESEEEDEEED